MPSPLTPAADKGDSNLTFELAVFGVQGRQKSTKMLYVGRIVLYEGVAAALIHPARGKRSG